MTENNNLIRDEYEALGGPTLTEGSNRFIDALWRCLSKDSSANLYQVTQNAGFEDEGDETMFIPLCERLVNMGVIVAHTELTNDPEREITIPGSHKPGVIYIDDYSDEEKKKFSVSDDASVVVTLLLSPKMLEKLAQYSSEVESEEDEEDAVDDVEESVDLDEVINMGKEDKEDVDFIEEPESLVEDDQDEEEDDEKLLDEILEDASEENREEVIEENAVEEKNEEDSEKILDEILEEAKEEQSDEDFEKSLNEAIDFSISKKEEVKEEQAEHHAIEEDDDDGEVWTPQEEIIEEVAANENEKEEAATEEQIEEPKDESDAQVIDSAQETKWQPQPIKLGATPSRFRRTILIAAGLFLLSGVGYLAYTIQSQISDKTSKIEAHLDTPTQDVRLIKKSELEQLQRKIAEYEAKIASMERQKDLEIKAAVNEAIVKKDKEIENIKKSSFEEGRTDAIDLSSSMRERLNRQGLNQAVVRGECEAYGDGNLIHRLFPNDLPVTVQYWLVDPSNQQVAGMIARNADLLARKDGAITHIKCVKGDASIWPSYKPPVIGDDGKARPIDENGEAVETNELLN